MYTNWRHKTQTGRIVYDRKPNWFNQKDIDRIVRRWTETENDEVLFMSDIADRILWWIALRIRLDVIVGWVANRLFNVQEVFRDGITGYPLSPRITSTEADLLAWMSGQAEAVSPVAMDEKPDAQLARLESYLQSFLALVQERRAAQ